MVFYYLGGITFFVLRSFMWLAHKPVHITTPIGRGEPDPVQACIVGGPRSLVINGLQYFPKKEPTQCLSLEIPKCLSLETKIEELMLLCHINLCIIEVETVLISIQSQKHFVLKFNWLSKFGTSIKWCL